MNIVKSGITFVRFTTYLHTDYGRIPWTTSQMIGYGVYEGENMYDEPCGPLERQSERTYEKTQVIRGNGYAFVTKPLPVNVIPDRTSRYPMHYHANNWYNLGDSWEKYYAHKQRSNNKE